MAQRKLNFILKSKSITVPSMKIEDLIQVFIKIQHENRGKQSSAKPVLAYNKKSGIVTVLVRNGRLINAAVEDVRFSITDKELALKQLEANDNQNSALQNLLILYPTNLKMKMSMILETLNMKKSARFMIFMQLTKLKFIGLEKTNSILYRFLNMTKIPVNTKQHKMTNKMRI